MSYRNVVLIVLDTVRKDYFDEYAYRLQDRSDVTFSNCRAASSWSVPSHASMITGELPHVHGIHTHDRYFDNLQKNKRSSRLFRTTPHLMRAQTCSPVKRLDLILSLMTTLTLRNTVGSRKE